MTYIRSRADVLSLVDTNLPSGTGAITATNHRAVVQSALRSLVALGEAEIRVINMTTTAPPGAPADRDSYVVASGGSGDWSGQDGNIAVWDDNSSPAAWFFITPTDGQSVWNLADDKEYRFDGSAWAERTVAASAGTQSIIIACSDETTDLTTGTAKVTFRMPYAFTLSGVRASVTTAPTGSGITVDINEAGASILSTLLTIDATEKTSTTAATAAVISDTALADDAEITIDIDAVGSTIAGAGLKVALIGVKA